MAVRTVRCSGASVLATAALVLAALLGTPFSPSPAGAATPQWETTATYTPLVNVRAVSCAPGSTTCVAVGDDGGHFASIIVSDDGGVTWTDATPPPGVTSLSTVSCPSAAICYAGGGSGILKSTDGGVTWAVQDSGFPAQSISCSAAATCMAAGGTAVMSTSDGLTWISDSTPVGLDSLVDISCVTSVDCVGVGSLDSTPSILATQDGSKW
ncbi:MAG TPA: hypothetical protein VEG62_09645, partial [Acidimicrobiales bacterium]|nr:hypothetical protein [Acidimicrobiales bacterium]